MYRNTNPPPEITYPRTVVEIFADNTARRNGFHRAFFIDSDSVYALCDPESENLCLFAYPNETWDVTLPDDEVPPLLPEPALGINFARDGMQRSAWFQFVALHCDAWLISLAFFFGAHLNSYDRNCLFNLINDRVTLKEQVTNWPTEL